jgi:hypothetical protein
VRLVVHVDGTCVHCGVYTMKWCVHVHHSAGLLSTASPVPQLSRIPATISFAKAQQSCCEADLTRLRLC